jgi:Domain of unknown function (DUF2427)
MFSIAKSRYSTLLNLFFLLVNGLGFFFGMLYNMSTPDLYENNAHHKIGWIFTITAVVWAVLGLIKKFAPGPKRVVSYQPLTQHEEHGRWSDDSGRATLRNLSVGSVSPVTEQDMQQYSDNLDKIEEEADEAPLAISNSRLGRYVAPVAKHLTGKVFWTINFIYVFIERTLLIMGFILISTGFVTFGGVFVSSSQG